MVTFEEKEEQDDNKKRKTGLHTIKDLEAWNPKEKTKNQNRTRSTTPK